MITKEFLRTKDGADIAITIYSIHPGNGILIIAPQAGLTQFNYTTLVRYFYNTGYNVISFDYRGTGESVYAGNENISLTQWAKQDMDAVIRHARHRFPEQQLSLVAHGVSGELLALCPASQFIKRLVFLNGGLSCTQSFNRKAARKPGLFKKISRAFHSLINPAPPEPVNKPAEIPAGVQQEWQSWYKKPNGLFDFFPDTNCRKMQIPVLEINNFIPGSIEYDGLRDLISYYSSCSIVHMPLSLSPTQVNQGSDAFFDDQTFFTIGSIVREWDDMLVNYKMNVYHNAS